MPTLAELAQAMQQQPMGPSKTYNDETLKRNHGGRGYVPDDIAPPTPGSVSAPSLTQAEAVDPKDALLAQAKQALSSSGDFAQSVNATDRYPRATQLRQAHPGAYDDLDDPTLESKAIAKESQGQGYQPGLADSQHPALAAVKGFFSGAADAATPGKIGAGVALASALPTGGMSIPAAALLAGGTDALAEALRVHYNTPHAAQSFPEAVGNAAESAAPAVLGQLAGKVPGVVGRVLPQLANSSTKAAGLTGATIGGVTGYRQNGILGAAEGALTGGVLGAGIPRSLQALQALRNGPAAEEAAASLVPEAAWEPASSPKTPFWQKDLLAPFKSAPEGNPDMVKDVVGAARGYQAKGASRAQAGARAGWPLGQSEEVPYSGNTDFYARGKYGDEPSPSNSRMTDDAAAQAQRVKGFNKARDYNSSDSYARPNGGVPMPEAPVGYYDASDHFGTDPSEAPFKGFGRNTVGAAQAKGSRVMKDAKQFDTREFPPGTSNKSSPADWITKSNDFTNKQVAPADVARVRDRIEAALAGLKGR